MCVCVCVCVCVKRCVFSWPYLSYDLFDLWSDDLSLLVLGSGWTLTIPICQLLHRLHQVVHTNIQCAHTNTHTHLQVEQGPESGGIVIDEGELLIVNCTADLHHTGPTVQELEGGV